jgi:cellulose synthase/poly-beta-1,6-N-acetylglucosamine synthase-like glycosyltransferase
MASLFWFPVAFVLYVYVGYPAALGVWTWLRVRARRRSQTTEHSRDSRAHALSEFGQAQATRNLPGVSIVIAARNEAARLPARIESLLASDYPADRLEVIVASDGSTDDTVASLARFDGRVTLLQLPASGKASALNAAVLRATHPILVFADARQRFTVDAIRRLVASFADPEIGAVSGELVIDPAASTIGDGVGAYWTYEKWLRRHEAIVGSTLGVTGAIYAMRRSLWQPLPIDTLLDDVLGPMRLVLRGYRVIFEPGALAYDAASPDASAELRRKIRTLAGNFQLLAREPRLLVPGANPVWLQFMSHKVGRLLVPYALLVILASSAALATTSRLYAVALAGQLLFYGLAAYGAWLDRHDRVAPPVSAPKVFREAA